MVILTLRKFVGLASLSYVVVVQSLEVRQLCPGSPLLVLGPPVCASTCKAASIYRHRSHSPYHSWDGPLDCQGDYCVYSNRAVSKHPWVILCTTPEAAQGLGDHFHIVPNNRHLFEPLPYYVAEVPWKGRGLIANRKIHKGERIIAEDAILALPIQAHLELPSDRRRHLYDMILENLPPVARDEFLSQVGEDVTTVIDRNGFEIHTGRDDDAVRYVGAFPEQAITTAVRDIDAGEELSLSYIEVTLPLRHRQARLSALWNFNCTCEQCQLSSAKAKSSDTRVERIKLLEDIMDHPAKSFPAGDLLAQTGSELVALYEQEQLDVYIGYAYRRAALNFALFADENNAKESAQKALRALEWQGGSDQKDLENMRGLLADPKAHWSWARLAGQHRGARG